MLHPSDIGRDYRMVRAGVFFANACRVDRVQNEAVWFQPLVRALGDVTAIQLSTIEEATASGVRPAVDTVASAR